MGVARRRHYRLTDEHMCRPQVQLVGTYFTALVAALLTGLVLRQPKLAVEAWCVLRRMTALVLHCCAPSPPNRVHPHRRLQYEGGAAAERVAGSGGAAVAKTAESAVSADKSGGRLFKLLMGGYLLYFGWQLVAASPFVAWLLVAVAAAGVVLFRSLLFVRPVWKPSAEYTVRCRLSLLQLCFRQPL